MTSEGLVETEVGFATSFLEVSVATSKETGNGQDLDLEEQLGNRWSLL